MIVTIFGCSNGTPDLTYGDYDQAEEEAKQEERQQLLDEIKPELEKMEEAGLAEAYAKQKVDEFMAILENNITGYSTEIPPEIFSTPADENGHGNTYYVLDGHLESFISAQDYMPESFSGEEYDSMYMADVTTADGNEIVIYNVIIPTKDVSIEKYKDMVGKDVRVWFEYGGFSEVEQVAMGLLHFMTDDPTGLRDLPIELDFNINAALTIRSMLMKDTALDEAKIRPVGDGYYVFEGSAQYVSDDEAYKVTESVQEACKDFFEKQELVFISGELSFVKDGETVVLYEFDSDKINVSDSSDKDNDDKSS